jgi:hypothetical protein
MRAKEFIPEAAPSLGAPTAAQNLSKLAAKASTKPTPGSNGFLSNVAAGFKQGMGMDPDQSLAQGVAVKSLAAAGMRDTATSVANINQQRTGQQKPGEEQPGQETNPASIKMPLPGTFFRDPKLGNVKVLPNGPGQKGLHLDTTKSLGMPIYVDPKDLKK